MNRYLTTTLPYVNASPHVGFALEIVEADALVRAWRLMGDEVFFNTGTDEHGQKILQAATAAGEGVQAYADRYAAEFRKLADALNLSVTKFIRTTGADHVAAAQAMWKRCADAGDIYKKAYTGLYCVGCESFKTEKEIIGGHCELHPNLTLEEVTEENYFFAFSKYADRLLEYLSREDSVAPDWRRQEAITFVRAGLEDFSISRESKRLSWGVPVPGDQMQVMYVWFDALTNYISTLGWPDESGDFKKFWVDGRTLQVAGKDQVRFQSLMWQAMLMSAGIKNTDQVFYHGFVTSGGAKMSKSLGNVISPYDLVEKYGADATRYILLRHAHPTEDSDMTWGKLDEWYTANLVNGLGNLVARVMKLAETYLPEPAEVKNKFGDLLDASVYKDVGAIPGMPSMSLRITYREAMKHFEFHYAMGIVWAHISGLDERITREEPFRLVKENPEMGKIKIKDAVLELARIALLLAPLMPNTSGAILEAIRLNKKPENLFPRLA